VREALIWWGGASGIVTVDGLSIQVMARNLSALNRSLAEGVTRRSTVDDSAHILAGRARFSTGSLHASTSAVDSGMATEPTYASGRTGLR